MAKYCTNCGTQLADNALFCLNCGIKQATKTEVKTEGEPQKEPGNAPFNQYPEDIDFRKINHRLKVKNSQRKPVTISLLIALISVVLVIMSFTEGSPLHGIYAITLVGIFVAIAALITAVVFRSRAKKLDTLISGENVIASWSLSEEQKTAYVNTLFRTEQAKNKAILIITVVLIVLIFGAFIVFIEEGKAAMLVVMLVLIVIISAFALGMPRYYRSKNLRGDGVVLLGKKFAYINGFFHNWDFPLSGIQKVKMIDQPFHGLFIQYYYYDRTLKNTEELNIPAPAELDLKNIVALLKSK
ncbi:zinc ribbon domain-containing protein [Maribellus luteus]|uniref:Zinc ribbon domain-containing protein n=1 Tax=Maribellus luteus TaxID=2305463 RepID=A0A399T3Z3_9BACT|nr:zinc ribbon domain-containing protein [Maribellus luteus]RIJ48897.1 zinc ribbon domain-containing protein [Maribellus luteus]